MAPNVATRVAFKNILFATDFSAASEHALLHALAMAKRYDSRLSVVHVAPAETQVPIPMEPVPMEIDWQKKRARESLAHLEQFEPLQHYPHETILRQGNPWLELSGLIEDQSIDLIVLGTHGRGLLGTVVLGSVAEQFVRHASCPVMTIGPNVVPGLLDREQLQHVLFATDFSESSMRALPVALSLAEEDNAWLTMLHAEEVAPVPAEYSDQLVADSEKRLWELLPRDANLWCQPQVVVKMGLASDTIIQVAHDNLADMIVMGVHRGGAMASHLPWSVVHMVLRHARCPVLTVR